ncbi:MAG: hypothetical protein NTW28_15735 [Candidatus Solibacter sp.]|nr:hypothetical protein [Candidatus Solibacter sp.]
MLRRAPRWLALLLVSAGVGHGEKLPLKIYTAADGLAHNSVNRIVRDSRGYLWFGTSEGLSRFDGYEFHSYGRRDGLPHRVVNDVLETRSGEFWIATAGGLCRYAPKRAGKQRFQVYRAGNDDRSSRLNVLLEDRLGGIWCGTDAGVFRLEQRPEQTEPVWKSIGLGMPTEGWADQAVHALLQDPRGDLWVGASSGLYRLRVAGGVERYTEREGLPQSFITVLLLDRQHRIWAGTRGGLCKLIADPTPGRRVVEASFHDKDGLGSESIEALHQLTDGTLFVGTKMGLSAARADRSTGSQVFSPYTALNGLPASGVEALAEDTAGNLWIGTDGSGVAKLVWNTFLSYTAIDGLVGTKIDSIFEDGAGRMCVRAFTSMRSTAGGFGQHGSTCRRGPGCWTGGPARNALRVMANETGGSEPATGCCDTAEFREPPTWSGHRQPDTRSATGCPRARLCQSLRIPPATCG